MKQGYFFKASRVTLIRSVLSGISIYYLSLSRASGSTLKIIKTYTKDFLWERVDEGKGFHLVSWEFVECPVNQEWLEIGNLGSRNKALLAKWLSHCPWKDVANELPSFSLLVCYIVGDGQDTYF